MSSAATFLLRELSSSLQAGEGKSRLAALVVLIVVAVSVVVPVPAAV